MIGRSRMNDINESYLTLPRMRKLLDDSTSPKKKILHTSDFNYIVYQAQALVYQVVVS